MTSETIKARPFDLVEKMLLRYNPESLTANRRYKMATTSYESLSHSKWVCKYHIVFVPKCRRKVLYGKVRSYLGPIFHELTRVDALFGARFGPPNIERRLTIAEGISKSACIGAIVPQLAHNLTKIGIFRLLIGQGGL